MFLTSTTVLASLYWVRETMEEPAPAYEIGQIRGGGQKPAMQGQSVVVGPKAMESKK